MNNGTFQNRELETRDPKTLTVVTKALLKRYVDNTELYSELEKFYDLRAERGLDEQLRMSVEESGGIHTPLFITELEGFGEVVVAGRQRHKVAMALGMNEVPVILHDNDAQLSIAIELTENLSRTESTELEKAQAYKKALQNGMTQDQIAKSVGLTPASISYTLTIGEMPDVVHKAIEKGNLTPTAALALKSIGKKARKGSGVSRIYDKAEVKAVLENMSAEAKLAGKNKVSVKQAKQSKAGFVEGLTSKEWDALITDSQVPPHYAALISVFRNKISLQQARIHGELGWLRKIAPQPKPKKEKTPKVKSSKKESMKDEDFDPASLFNA